MLLAGLGLLVSGCAAHEVASGGYTSRRPHTDWPDAVARPARVPSVAAPKPAVSRPVVRPPRFSPIGRSQWAKAGPVGKEINAMNGISRLTVHHEGWTPVWFTDYASTAKRMEHIRNSHVKGRHWADIGYHYIIDRSGRVWEGRDLRYQGAHVSKNNEHNVGVMLLGNFEKQRPSDAQLNSLRQTLQSLMHRYQVPVSRVYTHQELQPTACPGRHLQPRIASMRSGSYLT